MKIHAIKKLRGKLAAGQPVYFTRKPTDLTGTPYLTMIGPLIYLQTSPQTQAPSGLLSVNANFENELETIKVKLKVLYLIPKS